MEESFAAMRTNHLDPAAQEFYPSSQFALQNPQNYNYPYPPPPPPSPFPSHYVHPPQSAADDNPSSRAVVLSMVPPHVTEASITHSMMAFGGVRAIDTNFLSSEGIVTVHFYDLRSAQVAVAEVREQHVLQQSRLAQQFYGIFPAPPPQIGGRGLIEGQAVWAQFGAKGLDVLNQGSLFVTVSGPSAISSDGVREIFEAFGPVKEVRESPTRIQNKFVEFFDVRDAARAHNELSGRDVGGVRLTVDFSRPTGSQSRSYNQQNQHQSRRSSHQSFPLPPRLARSSSQASSSDGSSRGKQCARISSVSKNSVNSSNKQGKKNKGDNSNNRPSSSTPSSKQGGGGGGGGSIRKNWKNHGSKNSGTNAKSISSDSCRFEIKEAAVAVVEGSASSSSGGSSSSSSSSSCMRDARTTVMIKNIPNKYSQKLLLNMLDNHCIHCNEQIGEGGGDEPLSAYDFVYLPIDFNNKCNVGYGFVNLTSPEAAVRLYKAFHMQPWEVFNSRKICQVTYARLQGLEVLKEHFRNSKFACDNDEYLPVVFEPARDGKQVTEPLPIGGRSSGDLLTKIPSEGDDGDDDDSKGADEGEVLLASSLSLQMQQLQVSSSSPSSYI